MQPKREIAGEGPIAIIAGAGRLPLQLVEHLEKTGQDYRILAFRGFAAPELRKRAQANVDLLDLKTIMSTLEGWRPRAVSLVGAVRRPGFTAHPVQQRDAGGPCDGRQFRDLRWRLRRDPVRPRGFSCLCRWFVGP